MAQEEFGVRGALLLALIMRTTAQATQMEFARYAAEITLESDRVDIDGTQSAMSAEAIETTGKSERVGPGGPQTEIDSECARGHPRS